MNKKICFFCVGTGGHVLPVKNLVQGLINKGISKEKIIVITDKRGSVYLKDLSVEVKVFEFYASKNGILGYLLNLRRIFVSILQIYSYLKNKKISIYFSTGSYISPIAGVVSKLNKCKFFIQEQNVYAGLGNKLASIFAFKIFTSFELTLNINDKKCFYSGPIINTKLIPRKIEDLEHNSIGFYGGSQGSEQINNFVEKFLQDDMSLNHKIIHITGEKHFKNIETNRNYKNYGFLVDIDKFYKEVSIIVGRAGGGSLEPAFLGIPQILIPYKFGTTSSHQSLNADFIEKNGFGYIVNTYEELINTIKLIILNLKNKKELPALNSGNNLIIEELFNELY